MAAATSMDTLGAARVPVIVAGTIDAAVLLSVAAEVGSRLRRQLGESMTLACTSRAPAGNRTMALPVMSKSRDANVMSGTRSV